jgi:hypothetical protein
METVMFSAALGTAIAVPAQGGRATALDGVQKQPKGVMS